MFVLSPHFRSIIKFWELYFLLPLTLMISDASSGNLSIWMIGEKNKCGDTVGIYVSVSVLVVYLLERGTKFQASQLVTKRTQRTISRNPKNFSCWCRRSREPLAEGSNQLVKVPAQICVLYVSDKCSSNHQIEMLPDHMIWKRLRGEEQYLHSVLLL